MEASRNEQPLTNHLGEFTRAIDALPEGAEKIKLQMSLLEQRRAAERSLGHRIFESAKAVGVIALALSTVWTLSQGVSEYVRAGRERAEAQLFASLASVTENTSPARRASALVTIQDFVDDQELMRTAHGSTTVAERVGLVLAFQYVDEPSPTLRFALLEVLGSDTSMVEIALYLLSSVAMGLGDQQASEAEPKRSALQGQLRNVEKAIGVLLKDMPNGKPVDDALDISEWYPDRRLTLSMRGADLRDLNFGDADLTGWDFATARLANANFTKARLDHAAISTMCALDIADRPKMSVAQDSIWASACENVTRQQAVPVRGR